MNKTVLVTGAHGLIGVQLVAYLQTKGLTILTPTRAELDITDKEQIAVYFENNTFDNVVHLAAYTAVDRAEEEPEECYDINVNATRYLHDEAIKSGKDMIYISTDFVFDGNHPPYTEDSIPSPLGVYAKSKYEGEEIVKNDSAIIRISYPYGPKQSVKKDIVHTIADLLKEGKTLTMVTDSAITPSYIPDICANIYTVIAHFKPGIYHSVGDTSISPYNLGLLVASIVGATKDQIQLTTFAEFYQGKAPRPQHLVTNKTESFTAALLKDALEKIL